MAILQVLKFPNPELMRKSLQVNPFDEALEQLAAEMLETMYQEGGIGLAAPQVGQLKRLIVVDVRENEGESEEERRTPRIYVNPEILERSGEMVTEEGCLSVVEYTADVKRAQRIRLAYQHLDGTTAEEVLEDLTAVCLQHEVDHLDGKLFIDHLPPLKRQMVKKRLAKLARTA